MKYIIDIDGTICHTKDKDYPNSQPYFDRIDQVNKLYDEGNEIHYWTARGALSGIDWTELTIKQLKNWGCKYHSLKTGKPAYEVWVDDKAVNARQFFFWTQNENTLDRL